MTPFDFYIKRLKEDMTLRNFSDNTHDVYVRYVTKFIDFSKKEVEQLDEEDMRVFLLHLITVRNLADKTVNLYNCAIRFFFNTTLNKQLNFSLIPKQKKGSSLPGIFSREEITEIINALDDVRHKAFIMLGYGSGLRVSEIRTLRICDIDSKNMRLFVDKGKGNKDRYTILSQECLLTLRDYWKEYLKGCKEGPLFIGEDKEGLVSVQTIRRALKSAMKKVSIDKNLSTHALRHSFATHLYENGIDILVIKELLGHTSLRTTSRYIKIANATEKITSPLDLLKGGDGK